MSKTKLLILTTVFIDAVGIGIIVPILPFYVERFSSSPFLITSLFAVYAILSFLSAPVIGAASDRIGRKKTLLVSIFSTSAGWFIFALAPNIALLFLGRIVDGAAAGNLPIAQAYLTDIAGDDRERTTNLGLIGAVFGLAFIIGPALGGVLGSVSPTFPFWFVGGLALVNGILGIFSLPETNMPSSRGPGRGTKVSLNPFVPLVRAAKDKPVLPNYIAWFLFGLAVSNFIGIFALYLERMFGFNELTSGWVFTGFGLVVAVNQIVALRHFWLKHFKEPMLELVMLAIFAIGFLLMIASSITIFFAGLAATAFAQSILRTVMNSQIVAKAGRNVRGEALGVASSLQSLSMAIGPVFAGLLFTFNVAYPFISGALLVFAAFLVLYINRRSLNALELEVEEEPVLG